jgi:hypothetical protein
MKRLLINTIVLFLINMPFSFTQALKQGVFKFSTNEIFNTDLNNEIVGRKNFAHLWYKDSTVVIEHRINYRSEDQTPEGWVIKESYPVARYMFINLRTMLCQEYLNFKDTAKPFCNYQLKVSDTSEFQYFFTPKSSNDTLHGVFPLNDTIVNGINFKRIKILYKHYEFEKSYSLYYLDCRPNESIFYLNKTLSEIYSGCKAYRADFCDASGKPIIRTEITNIRNKLNATEENIFKCWTKNAVITTLPLISHSQASRINIPFPEHENPKITVMPLEKK